MLTSKTLLPYRGILVWYFVVQLMILPWAMRPDPMARELMLTQVRCSAAHHQALCADAS